MINRATLIGKICKDIKKLPNSIILRLYCRDKGDKFFINVVIMGGLTKLNFVEGEYLYVEGRLREHEYNGKKYMEVIANDIRYMSALNKWENENNVNVGVEETNKVAEVAETIESTTSLDNMVSEELVEDIPF